MSPLVTVLMTVYNGRRYLESSLRAVLDQTFRDFEFVVIDDHSSDGSPELIRGLKDDRIVLCVNERNLGQTASLNKGLRLARGHWVARMDADDLAFPHWLKCQTDFMRRNSNVAVLSTQAVVIDLNGAVTKPLIACIPPEAVLVKALTHSPINHVGSLLDREAVLKGGGYDEHYRIAADFDLWSRLLSEERRITSTGETTVAVRVHGDSISIKEKNNRQLAELTEIIERNFVRLAAHPLAAGEAGVVAALFYDWASLSTDDFFRAKAVLLRGYEGLKSRRGIDPVKLGACGKEILRKLDAKKMFSCIESGDVPSFRRIAGEGMSENGIFSFWGACRLWSWTGQAGLKLLPAVYRQLDQRRAHSRIRSTGAGVGERVR